MFVWARHVVTYVLLLEVAIYLSDDMYLPALPAMVEAMGISTQHGQMTMLAWFLGAASSQWVAGIVTDRFGTRRVVLFGAALFVLASMLCATATNIRTLILWRALQGVSMSFSISPAYALIHQLYHGAKAVRLLSLMASITVLAPALGPLIGGWLAMTSGWRMTFWVLVVMGLVAWVGLWKTARSPCRPEHDLTLKKALKGYGHLLVHAPFLKFAVTKALLIGAFLAWIIESPFVVINTLSQQPMVFGLVQLVAFSGFMIGARITRAVIHDHNVAGVIWSGFALVLLGNSMGLLFSAQGPFLWPVALSMTLFGVGASMAFGPLSRLAVESSPVGTGLKVSLDATLTSLVGAVACVVVGEFSDGGFVSLFLIVISFATLSILSFAVLARKLPLVFAQQEDTPEGA